MTIRIYHNPRCSKSRQTLTLIRDKGFEPEIVEYLKTPPSVEELRTLIGKLGLAPMDMVRRKEAEFAISGLDQGEADEARVLEALHSYPKLIERPIVVHGDRAVLGRPPENVLDIL
ncbi:MAG: arsenate reductase (glutaredoxin) [Ectothiorhodospiraceae bacterium]|nr:arsenate reductase (glutaredoxin) [Ectothiorhodospiraceae bacterium]MCH8505656.1 arsenate reductase (glutaredoxin) [Ectothiorhodospiraceae bacterium]